MNPAPKCANIYIDESGYKGKSHNLPAECAKKISVFVGVIVPTDQEGRITELFRPLFNKFKSEIPADMKLHITDAFASEDDEVQKLATEVRDGYLEIFKRERGLVLFGAKRAAIEKRSFDDMQKILTDAALKTNPALDIKRPHPKETLEGKAFMSMYGKMEAFAEDCRFDNITPLLDEIDQGKKQEYEDLINEFLHINSEKQIEATAWDRTKKQVIKRHGKIAFSIEGLPIENRVSNIQIVGKDNPLILLADILANYIHNYMISLPEEAPLHAPHSYIGFDLYENIYGLINNWLDDII